MFFLSIPMREFIEVVKSNMTFNDKIKEVRVVNDDEIQLQVSIGGFLPKIKLTLAYNYFNEGKAYLTIISNAPISLVMKVIRILNLNLYGDFFMVDSQKVVIDVNKIICDKLKGLVVTDIIVNEGNVKIIAKSSVCKLTS